MATVYDRNAHAWTEVWVDGIGWRQLEMTPEYVDMMNVVIDNSPGNNTETTLPSDTVDTTTPKDTEMSTPADTYVIIDTPATSNDNNVAANFGDIKIILFIIVTVALALLVILFSKTVYNSYLRKKYNKQLLKIALIAESLDDQQRLDLGTKLSERLTEILSLYGYELSPGELPSDYGKRLQKEMCDIDLAVSPIYFINAMSSLIYGKSDSSDNISTVADAIRDLSSKAGSNISFIKYIYYSLVGKI
jgi:hypothetical protein